MASTTIKVTVEQITRTFRSERMPDSDKVRLVANPPWEEFTLESEDWTARGYLSRILVEGMIDHPPLVCLSVKRWDDEEWTGMAMTPDEARSLAAHLLALAGPDPEAQVEAGPDPEDVIERAIAASTPVAPGLMRDLERVVSPPDVPKSASPVTSWTAMVVETDNYDVDYPDELFHGPPMPHADAERIAASFNKYGGSRRYYKVVPIGYKLRHGFEP